MKTLKEFKQLSEASQSEIEGAKKTYKMAMQKDRIIDEAHTKAQAETKFKHHNDAELKLMDKRQKMIHGGADFDLKSLGKMRHKAKRHGQAAGAAYKIMMKEDDLDEAHTLLEGPGVSQEVINRRIRSLLDKHARSFNGTRSGKSASGSHNGKSWSASYRVLRASNGEAALYPHYTIDGKSHEGYGHNLEKLLKEGTISEKRHYDDDDDHKEKDKKRSMERRGNRDKKHAARDDYHGAPVEMHHSDMHEMASTYRKNNKTGRWGYVHDKSDPYVVFSGDKKIGQRYKAKDASKLMNSKDGTHYVLKSKLGTDLDGTVKKTSAKKIDEERQEVLAELSSKVLARYVKGGKGE